ncbi:hypothetical protein NM897_05195 [Planococcus maritimus]|uniref:RNA polymerase sigma factor n=1 Tax=Planococcus maritimus TaxID=192421 RepID=UPI00313A2B55
MTTGGKLLERLKLSDKAALEMIYDEYYLLLWKVSYRKFNDQAVCERVLTEVFQQLWKHPQQFSGNKRLMFYLMECLNDKIANLKQQSLLESRKSCSS